MSSVVILAKYCDFPNIAKYCDNPVRCPRSLPLLLLVLLGTLTIIRNGTHLYDGWRAKVHRCFGQAEKGCGISYWRGYKVFDDLSNVCLMFSDGMCGGHSSRSACVCGHIRLVLTKHATGEVRTVWWVFGTSASFTGGTEVLGYHRGVPRYAVGGAQGFHQACAAPCHRMATPSEAEPD